MLGRETEKGWQRVFSRVASATSLASIQLLNTPRQLLSAPARFENQP